MKKGREEEKRERGEREHEQEGTQLQYITVNAQTSCDTDSEFSSVAYHIDGFHMSKQISYMYLNYEL